MENNRDMTDINNVLNRLGILARDATTEAIQSEIDGIVRTAEEKQKENDLICAVKAFVEMKVPDDKIYALLSTHFGVDSIALAKNCMKQAYVEQQLKKLKELLNLSPVDWVHYRHKYAVQEKLEQNAELWKLSPEKLKIALEK